MGVFSLAARGGIFLPLHEEFKPWVKISLVPNSSKQNLRETKWLPEKSIVSTLAGIDSMFFYFSIGFLTA